MMNISKVLKPAQDDEVEEAFREAVPRHSLFKIQAFSLLSMNSIDKYESNEFEAGGYKWSLSLYPNGNKAENGNDHISLYLALEDATCLGLNVFFKLFLFDHIRNKYLIRAAGKTSRRFDMNKVQGFPQFVSIEKFKDPSNGYLVDDTCVFGAEIFVTVKYTWRIENFSNIEETLYSEKFKAGDHNWDVNICPIDYSFGNDICVSLYLNYLDCEENSGSKVYADCKFRIRDQINGNHILESVERNLFSASSRNWPTREKFLELGGLNDKENGYLVEDTCIVEAEVQVVEVVASQYSFIN